MADVSMPQLGETVTEGTITQWFKAVGDSVEVDEPLFEVSTDKVDSEVPSPASGVLQEILVPEGETVDVGTKLAVLGDGDGSAPAPAADEEAPAEEKDGGAGDEAPAEEPEAEPEPEASAEDQDEAPAAEAEAEPEPEPVAEDEAPAPSGGGEGRVGSPLVRRLIAKHGLDAASITGTGPGGRITRGDVMKVVESGGGTAAPAAAPAPSQAAPAAAPAPVKVKAAADGTTTEPLNNIRRLTGEHMVRSQQTSPHVLTAMEVDFEGVDRVRRAHRSEWKDAGGLQPHLPAVRRPGRGRRHRGLPPPERLGRRGRAPGPQPRAPGHRRRPRLPGPARPGRAQRRVQAPAGHLPGDPGPGRPGPPEEAVGRRDPGRHLHHHQPRAVRDDAPVPGHQPAPGGDPVHRRRAPEAGRR